MMRSVAALVAVVLSAIGEWHLAFCWVIQRPDIPFTFAAFASAVPASVKHPYHVPKHLIREIRSAETAFDNSRTHLRSARGELDGVKTLVGDSRRATKGLQHAMDRVYRLVAGDLADDAIKNGRKLAKRAEAEGTGVNTAGLKPHEKAKLKAAQDKVDAAVKEQKKVEAKVGVGHGKVRKVDPRVEVAVEAHFDKKNNPPLPTVDKKALDQALAFKRGQKEAAEVAETPILGKRLGPQ